MSDVITWGSPTEAEANMARGLLAASDTLGADGELLAFRNAVLARVETNKNGDCIDEQGLSDLAASIQFMPVDDEHLERKVVGFFLGGEAQEGALVTSGVLFAKRFPREIAAVISGAKELSVEADVSEAECSVCGGVFRSRKDYCEHLRDRSVTGAVRKLRGLKCVGGAIVFSPAGTDTKFSRSDNGLKFIASEGDEGGAVRVRFTSEMTEMPLNASAGEDRVEGDEDITPDVVAAVDGEVQMFAPDSVVQDGEQDQPEPDVVAEMSARLATLEAANAVLEERVVELQGGLDAANADLERGRITVQRVFELLRAGAGVDEVEALGDKIATAEPEVLAALVKYARAASSDAQKSQAQKPEDRSVISPGNGRATAAVIGDTEPVGITVTPATRWSSVFGTGN